MMGSQLTPEAMEKNRVVALKYLEEIEELIETSTDPINLECFKLELEKMVDNYS